MKTVAVILCGSGHLDGSEIHEATLTLLHLSHNGAQYQCFAPDKNQTTVKNHVTREPFDEKRNCLVEAARIARGNIKPITSLKASDYDALILPGGFGAALNLCDFALKGKDCTVDSDVVRIIKEFHALKKTIGAICIAPVIVAKVLGSQGVQVTIGTDAGTAAAITSFGARHVNKNVNEICVDETNRVISTPAYMLGKNIAEIDEGIGLLVKAVSNN